MKTQSTERERINEQNQRNQRRRDWWRRKQTDYVVQFLDGGDVPIKYLPLPIFHRRQAD